MWKVLDTRPLVDGPATLRSLENDSFTLDFRFPGEALVRLRHSAHWSVDAPACVEAAFDGWTRVVSPVEGEIEVRQSVGLGGSGSGRCGD